MNMKTICNSLPALSLNHICVYSVPMKTNKTEKKRKRKNAPSKKKINSVIFATFEPIMFFIDILIGRELKFCLKTE